MLKGAIIGVGKIAQEGHIPAFLDPEISLGAEIVAAVDPSPETIKLAEARYPQLNYYLSVGQMFRKEKVDFIDICSPPHTHAMMIEEGLSRNVHILCEKPFVLDSSEAQRLHKALLDFQRVFMPVHQYKYSPLWRTFKEEVSREPENKSILQFNVFRTEADNGISSLKTRWRTDPSVGGGGILSDTGVHYLYLSLWMLGEPQRITARTLSISHLDYNVEDTALVVLESEKGIAQINLTWGADRRANSASLVNNKGSLIYNGSELLRYSSGQSKKIPVPDASDKKNYIALYVSLMRDFLRLAGSGIKDNCQLDEAYKSVKLLHSCYEAAGLNQTISVG